MTDSDLMTPTPEIDRSDWFLVAAFVAIWGLTGILINPIGDFPLNDDWSLGLPVKWLVETGRLRFTDWQYMTLVAQVFWGALFASVAGFSFTVLRISTLVIAAVGLAATYLAGREVGLPRWLAAVVTSLFVVNPIFLALSLSFHTDVPFWALTISAVFLLLRGVRRGHVTTYWAGWVVVLIATLVRQVGLAVPIGLVVALALKDGLGRSWLIRAVLPAAVMFVVVAVVYPKVVQATIGLPANYYVPQKSLQRVFVELMHLRLGAMKPLLFAIGCGLMHLGWWMLPLILLLPRSWGAGGRRKWVAPVVAAGCATVVASFLWTSGHLMPLGSPGTYLVDLGTGPRTLGGNPPRAPVLFWVMVTVVSAIGATLLVLTLASIARRGLTQLRSAADRHSLWPAAFLITVGAFYYSLFGYFGPWFDRYLLLVMGLMGLLVAGVATRSTGACPRPSALRVAASAALAVAYLGFSVVSAHDYLAWNRSRWEAGRFLMADRDVGVADIDGGYEFNGYFSWVDHPGGTYGAGEGVFRFTPIGEPKGRARFAIAFSERPGFSLVRRVPVDRWSPLSPGQVLILERSDDLAPPTADRL